MTEHVELVAAHPVPGPLTAPARLRRRPCRRGQGLAGRPAAADAVCRASAVTLGMPARTHRRSWVAAAHGSRCRGAAASCDVPIRWVYPGRVALGSDLFVRDSLCGRSSAAAAVAKADADEHQHFPYARRLRLGWRHDADGHWTSDAEAVCGGRCSAPSAATRTDRRRSRPSRSGTSVRPYSSEHKAKHVAKKHFDDN